MLEAEKGSKVKGKIIKHSSVFSEYSTLLLTRSFRNPFKTSAFRKVSNQNHNHSYGTDWYSIYSPNFSLI